MILIKLFLIIFILLPVCVGMVSLLFLFYRLRSGIGSILRNSNEQGPPFQQGGNIIEGEYTVLDDSADKHQH